MGGRRQYSSPHFRRPSTRLDKPVFRIKSDLVPHPKPLVKIEQVYAAPQEQMLAVIHHFRPLAAHGPGRGASAQEGARLVKIHLETGAAQRRSRSQTGQAAAQHRNRWH